MSFGRKSYKDKPTTADELHEDVKRAMDEAVNKAPASWTSIYQKVTIAGQGPIPEYVDRKTREIVVGERGVRSIDPNPQGLGISVHGDKGIVVIPLSQIAWLRY